MNKEQGTRMKDEGGRMKDEKICFPFSAFRLPPSAFRLPLEVVVVLCIGVVLFQAFVAETYLIPTGSMSPTLLGYHRKISCPVCDYQFSVGAGQENDWSSEVSCPNCRHDRIQITEFPISRGDRILVQKSVFEFRQPRRWEIVVFRNPNDPSEVFVKRVVGLPGENIRITGGNVYINGRISRKTFEEFAKLSISVYDHNFVQADSAGSSRWVASRQNSRWKIRRGRLSVDLPAEEPLDSVRFRDFPDRPKKNFREQVSKTKAKSQKPKANYEADAVPQPVLAQPRHSFGADLLLECQLYWKGGQGFLEVVFHTSREKNISVRLHPRAGRVEFLHDGVPIRSGEFKPPADRPILLAVGLFDQRLAVRLDGSAPMPDLDFEDPVPTAHSPLSLAATDANLTIDELRIFRDIYYTSRTWPVWRTAGIQSPYTLGHEEYFVLGDNSSNSSDSRSWAEPAVRHLLLIGKPILVHLPSRTWKIYLFGRSIRLSLPDFGKIRRIE